MAFCRQEAKGSGRIPAASGIIPGLGWYESASSPNLPCMTSAHVLLIPRAGSCLLRITNFCFQSLQLGSRGEQVRRRAMPRAPRVIDK